MQQLFTDVPEAFSAAECDSIIALAESAGMSEATVYGGEGTTLSAHVRSVLTCYRPRTQETAWLYDRLDALFAEAAAALGTATAPMTEDIQLLRYGEGRHFQMWHSDAGYDAQQARLLSVSVELSEPSDYEGGVLEIAPGAMGGRTLPRGGARFFFSRALHRVTPVTRGFRWALVNWTGAAV